MALLAELTHRCPLTCFYCSNPLELERRATELTTGNGVGYCQKRRRWACCRYISPAANRWPVGDLPELVRHAAELQLYTNLITSGVLLSDVALDAAA